MANSSPPMRATVSVSRTSVRSRLATICSSLSPTGWPEGVVDVLEVIEVENVGDHDLVALGAVQRLLEPLVEQHAVGQAR